ncbi:MAG TPA: DNA polymerase III subunit alpha [Chthoniobacteraceae bacterium]|nr:DNA polymerase III subunit alpha [Chthoniobacteraceae bacterium]
MATDSFVHLHLHTEYSTLDGATRVADIMKKAKEYKMPAVGMTDHGVMYGAIEFYQEAEKAGIKPLVGCEVYVAPGSHLEKKATSQREASFHFTLLAKDLVGYHNLVKLVSTAHLDGMYYKPRIDKELLAKHAQGLVGLSGCLKGEVPYAINLDQEKEALELAATYRDILGKDNYFLEMQDHGIAQQMKINRVLPRFAKELGVGLVASNDVHFLTRSSHKSHDVLVCIGTGSNVDDERRMRYQEELYFKSPAEMAAMFGDHPEALSNTLKIAEMCDLKLEFGKPKYPNFTPPEGMTQNQYLRDICDRNMEKRYGERAMENPVIAERLERELKLLESQGFVNYFLIVWDFINWAKERGIPVGPGRGSAAGSMVAYLMGITDIDPIRFKLLFERFLNPERVSPPDIDVDFCQTRRGEVIEYVRQKYGERAVSQIITFGTLSAKSVVRDVARVLGWSYSDADRIAKMIPSGPGNLDIKLNGVDKKNKETGEIEHTAGAIDKNPELKKAVETEPAVKQLWEHATNLEGLTRGTGVHAAGVVISDRDLSEYIPLTRGNDGGIVSQYEMGALTDLGMLKMDFLGLKTLTVIDDAVNLIRPSVPDFDIATIPLDDQKTFDLLNRGESIAVFQLESGGMVGLCKQFDIHDIEDINAILALYRPGPMDLIPDYIKRKKGLTKIKYAHPALKSVTEETYGVMIYQEQVMAAASVLAGYTLGGADLLRRAMGKKDKEKMAKERIKFVAGCEKLHGMEEKKANEIFDLLEKFAGYGFNRSHSAAYAWVSYQTAYLKANFPVEFMAAVMSNEVNNTDKISTFVAECERMGIPILEPDVNRSSLKFAPEKVGDVAGIRYGMAAIKNVGEGAVQAVIEERVRGGAFTSLENFCVRVDSRKANKKTLESLVKCGALDWTGVERAALFAQIEGAMAAASSSHKDAQSGQFSMFDAFETAPPRPAKKSDPLVTPWTKAEKLGYEKELLGFYVTGHPLDEYRGALESGKYVPIANLGEQEDKANVAIAGALISVEKKFAKKSGKPFAVVILEDFTGSLEIMIWSETYDRSIKLLETGNVVSLTGRLDLRDDGVKVAANELAPLKKMEPKEKPVVLNLAVGSTTENDLLAIRDIIRQRSGKRKVELRFQSGGEQLRLIPADEYRIDWTPDVQEKLARWL